MSVKKTAYDTTACQGFVMQKTVHALQEAYIKGWLLPVPGTALYQVSGSSGSDAAIPAFSHPVLFEDSHRHAQMVVDVRSYGRFDHQAGEFRVKNPIEYGLQITRAKLNWIWVKDNPGLLRDVSSLPLAVYATWMAEQIARRFALDPAEQMQVSIYAAVFYLSSFIDSDAHSHFSEQDKIRVTNAIVRSLRIKAADVLKVMDQHSSGDDAAAAAGCPVITSVVHFCNLVSSVSVRLQGLNAGVLFALLGGTWYGTNAKEMVAVAVEHPPTWLAILLAAVNERTFKNSGITKITERTGFRDMARTYQVALLSMIANASGASYDSDLREPLPAVPL